MKKIVIIISILALTFSINAQSDVLKNIVKFKFNLNNLVKAKDIHIGLVGFEKAVCNKSSLAIWLGYDFDSSSLIVDKIDNVISSQTLKTNLDYRYYLAKIKSLQGFYAISSLGYCMSMSSAENERLYENSLLLGIGYQQIWKHLALEVQIEKGYRYSTFKNDALKLINSTVTPFNFTLSVGYIF